MSLHRSFYCDTYVQSIQRILSHSEAFMKIVVIVMTQMRAAGVIRSILFMRMIVIILTLYKLGGKINTPQ